MLILYLIVSSQESKWKNQDKRNRTLNSLREIRDRETLKMAHTDFRELSHSSSGNFYKQQHFFCQRMSNDFWTSFAFDLHDRRLVMVDQDGRWTTSRGLLSTLQDLAILAARPLRKKAVLFVILAISVIYCILSLVHIHFINSGSHRRRVSAKVILVN